MLWDTLSLDPDELIQDCPRGLPFKRPKSMTMEWLENCCKKARSLMLGAPKFKVLSTTIILNLQSRGFRHPLPARDELPSSEFHVSCRPWSRLISDHVSMIEPWSRCVLAQLQTHVLSMVQQHTWCWVQTHAQEQFQTWVQHVHHPAQICTMMQNHGHVHN